MERRRGERNMGWNMILRILLITLLSAFPRQLWATNYTSSQTGNASVAATWGGSGVPGDGDTALVVAGHTVTFAAAQIIGTSGATSTPALTVGGRIIINAPLTLKGDLVQNKGGVVDGNTDGVTTTGSLTFSPPTGSKYIWRQANTGSAYFYTTITGAQGHPFVFTTAQGGGSNAEIQPVAVGALTTTWDYVELSYMGDASNRAMNHGNGGNISISNMVVKNSGELFFAGDAYQSFFLEGIDIRNPSSVAVLTYANQADKISGSRSISNITVYSPTTRIVGIYSNDLYLDSVYLYNSTIATTAYIKRDAWSNIFSAKDTNGTFMSIYNQSSLSVTNAILLSDYDNPHYIDEVGTNGSLSPNVYNGIIFDGNGRSTGDAGDCLIPGAGEATLESSLNINKAGTLATLLNASAKLNAANNTSYNSYHINAGDDQQVTRAGV